MKKIRIPRQIAVVAGALLSIANQASAQQPESATSLPTGKSPVVKKPARPFEYRVSKEDTLSITCLQAAEYTVVATVLPDGTISYPKLGQVYVVGKTLRELEQIFTNFLKREFKRPNVSVAVRERQVRQVSVTGSGIKTTGKRVMRDGWRVLDAISDAGGLISDRNDLFTAKLVRYETTETIPIDLVTAYNNVDSDANVLLEPNDLLIIDAAEESKSQVLVIGEVQRPGSIIVPRDRTVSKAIEAAGGLKQQSALLSGAVIERNGEKIPLDLRQYVKDGTEPLVRLVPGDKLIIPENKRVVYMVGALGRQGATLIPDDRPMTLVRAISDAGVPLQAAETKKTQVIRQNADGTQTSTTINVEELLKKSDFSKDIPLEPGDIVYVPYKGGRKFTLADGTNAVWGIVQLRSVISSNFWKF